MPVTVARIAKRIERAVGAAKRRKAQAKKK